MYQLRETPWPKDRNNKASPALTQFGQNYFQYFQRLLHLYDMLWQLKPSPVVQMNKAIVLSYTGKTKEAIELMNSIGGIELLLKTQYMFNAVLGELYIKNNQPQQATDYLEKALQLTQSDAEKKLLKEKLNAIEAVLWN